MPLVGSKDSRCYVCGPSNPLGLRVSFIPDGEQGSQARYAARPEQAGWNGILHGGVAFALMDAAVTARVEIRVDGLEATPLAQAGATMCQIGQRTEFEASSNGKEPNRASVQ